MLASKTVMSTAAPFSGRRAPLGVRKNGPSAAPAAAASRRLSMYPPVTDELVQVSYSSTDSMHASSPRTMPAAARAAFKALERDSIAAIARSRLAPSAMAAAAASPPADSAIDTLCLVTYSEDEDAAAASWHQQQHLAKSLFTSSIVSAAAAATAKAQPGKAGAIFAALCSEDHTEEGDAALPGVMETLCMLSYDEDSV